MKELAECLYHSEQSDATSRTPAMLSVQFSARGTPWTAREPRYIVLARE
jgi:hypothetical protein